MSFFPLVAGWAGTLEEAKVLEQPPAKTPWQITVGGPGWLAGASGHTGFHGVNPYIDVGVGQILKHINYYDDFRDESAHDFLYQIALHGAQITVGLTF